jgi:hypothetical protein
MPESTGNSGKIFAPIRYARQNQMAQPLNEKRMPPSVPYTMLTDPGTMHDNNRIAVAGTVAPGCIAISRYIAVRNVTAPIVRRTRPFINSLTGRAMEGTAFPTNFAFPPNRETRKPLQ